MSRKKKLRTFCSAFLITGCLVSATSTATSHVKAEIVGIQSVGLQTLPGYTSTIADSGGTISSAVVVDGQSNIWTAASNINPTYMYNYDSSFPRGPIGFLSGAFITKTSSDGALLCYSPMNVTSNWPVSALKVIESNTGGLIFTHSRSYQNLATAAQIRVVNDDCTMSTLISLGNYSTIRTVDQASNGDIIVGGHKSGWVGSFTPVSGGGAYVASYSLSGTLNWMTWISSSIGSEEVEDLAVDSNDNIYASYGNGIVSKLSSSGTRLWESTLTQSPARLVVDAQDRLFTATIRTIQYTRVFSLSRFNSNGQLQSSVDALFTCDADRLVDQFDLSSDGNLMLMCNNYNAGEDVFSISPTLQQNWKLEIPGTYARSIGINNVTLSSSGKLLIAGANQGVAGSDCYASGECFTYGDALFGQYPLSAPTGVTGTADSVWATSGGRSYPQVRVTGIVSSNTVNTTLTVEYGTDPNLSTRVSSLLIGTVNSQAQYSTATIPLGGLTNSAGQFVSVVDFPSGRNIYYRIIAQNYFGQSISTIQSVMTAGNTSAITQFSIGYPYEQIDAGKLRVFWTASNGRMRGPTYISYRKVGTSTWIDDSPMIIQWPNGLDWLNTGWNKTLTGLETGQEYEIQLHPFDTFGALADPPSIIAKAQTVPGPPKNFTAQVGDSSVSLSWDTPDYNGYGSIDEYLVQGSGLGECRIDSSQPLTCIFNGLTNGQSYGFSIRALNRIAGWSSPVQLLNNVTPIGRPIAPSAVMAIAKDQSVDISWNSAQSNGAPIQSYDVVSNPGGFTCSVISTVWNIQNQKCTITGLTNGVSYTFKVRATNSAGDGNYSSSSLVAQPIATSATPPNIESPPWVTAPEPKISSENLDPNIMSTLSSDKLNSYSSVEVIRIPKNSISAIPTWVILGLSRSFLSSLTAIQTSKLTAGQISMLSGTQTRALGSAGLKLLTTKQIRAFAPFSFRNLSSTQINALSSNQVNALTSSQAKLVTKSQASLILKKYGNKLNRSLKISLIARKSSK